MNFMSSFFFLVSAFATFTLPAAFACEDGIPCGKPSCPEYLRSLKRKQPDSNEPTFQTEKVQRVPLPLDSASLTSPTQQEIEQAVVEGNIDVVEELLHQVAEAQSISDVKRYLELYPQIFELEYKNGSRLPHFAAQQGHAEIMRLLLGNPVLQSKNKEGMTAFHFAAASGQVEVVKLLMDTPLLMSTDLGNSTALHYAAMWGRVEVVKLLMDTSLLMSTDLGNRTALHYAALWGRVEVVKLLMNTGLLMSKTKLGETALHSATAKGQVEVVKLLMDTPLLMSTDLDNRTALHYAASKRQVEVVKLLMKTPLLMSTNGLGVTALHSAGTYGQVEVVKLLMNTRLLMSTAIGNQTALHSAAWNGQVEVVKLLMNTPLLEVLTSNGWNAFLMAAVKGKIEVVKLLLNTPLVRRELVDNIGENTGCNAIHLAVFNSHPEVATLLLLSEPDLVFQKMLRQIRLGNSTFRASAPLELAQEPSRAQSFKEFIELVQSLIAFKDGNVAELVQHVKDGKAWSPLLFANYLARTPFDRTALNQLRGSLQETIFSLDAEFDIQSSQHNCKVVGLISPEQAVIAPCYSAQLKEVLNLVQARLMGSLQDGCARALAQGLKNMGRYYTSKYADRLQATPYNSFSGNSSYTRTASILATNLVPSQDGTAAQDLCEIWKSISPADRLFTDPKGFAEKLLGDEQ